MKRAEERLKMQEDVDFARAESSLERAVTRMQIAEKETQITRQAQPLIRYKKRTSIFSRFFFFAGDRDPYLPELTLSSV